MDFLNHVDQKFYQDLLSAFPDYETDHKTYTLDELKKYLINIFPIRSAITGEDELYASYTLKSEDIKIPIDVLEDYAILFQKAINMKPGYIANENIWFAMSPNCESVLWSRQSSLKKHIRKTAEIQLPKKKRFNRYTALINEKNKK